MDPFWIGRRAFKELLAVVCPVPPSEIQRIDEEDMTPNESVLTIPAVERAETVRPDFTLKLLSDTYPSFIMLLC